ncbi:MAG: hypothetical protein ETSY1_26085 [Candidatus Entotheonella factor]|uniref:Uncharacterized protein n=1 Tax=Entotheonella factor TaxID=1429438 RepID=W4LEZ6_ENTF1|nr:MAG: hypothetical protein ETSY1_26085 [Candidatus Entotheonella factor]
MVTWRQVIWLTGLALGLALLVGCEPLYHSYAGVERRPTTLPVTVTHEELWVSSVPAGADVYVQPFVPDEVPSHSSDPDMHKGTTPLQLTLPPGRYWIEVALDADVFSNYFSRPYDDVQFEKDGANSEALILQPFAPGETRRVVRYYRLDKLPDQGQTIVALFYPRGAPLERVVALYPQEEGFQMVPETLPRVLEEAQLPTNVQAPVLDLLRRGGKVFWARDNDFSVSLEVVPEGIRGRVIELYTGAPLPNPLLPDGGGF